MPSLVLRTTDFLASEDGPTAVEYAVMLVMVILIVSTALPALGNWVTNVFHRLDSGFAQ